MPAENLPASGKMPPGAEALRLHAFLPVSRANGPGKRAVIWVQGCSLGCPGCFNPQTHPFAGGEGVPVDRLLQRLVVLQGQVEGLTISGGEPFQQARPLLALLQGLRAHTSLSVLVFSGFTWEELQRLPGAGQILDCVDVLISGRYRAEQRLAHGLLGSANKQVHCLTNRYTRGDFTAIPPAEVVIDAGGQVVLSGIDPLAWG
jgi:anaerobic ribonucleoside-triphosphate reductase activating protein